MLMDWLKKAPTAVVLGFFGLTTVLGLATIGAYVLLSIYGDAQDLAEFRSWVQTIGIAIAVPLLGVNTVATWAGGRAASAAEENTNRLNDDTDRSDRP
jgi:hypothetical protein